MPVTRFACAIFNIKLILKKYVFRIQPVRLALPRDMLGAIRCRSLPLRVIDTAQRSLYAICGFSIVRKALMEDLLCRPREGICHRADAHLF